MRAVEADGGRAKPTRVLQRANLSHDRLTKYLGELVEKKLVSENEDNGNRYYMLTSEGIKFLEELKRAESFVSGFGLSF
jgi:predicted transcriptional regulator